MQLSEIQIENFRSIKSQTITFDHNCLILVGKNEAGKSNILKAIAAVFGEYQVSDKDKRKKNDNEEIKSFYIRAILKLSEKDFDEILNRFQQKYANTEHIVFANSKTLREFIKYAFYEFLITINIADGKKICYQYWLDKNNDFELGGDIYLNGSSFSSTTTGTKQTLQTLQAFIHQVMIEIYEENPYNCHYWEYNGKYLLPNSIIIATFRDNPSTCPPLKNIFTFCKRENINQEFTDAKSQDGSYWNLLGQISKEVTKTFREIWQDFKETTLELLPDGEKISILISNKARYTCEDRSDGFKKFISILLILSTQARSNKVGERDIILIDEPDQSLYPTSARYLRDELLKIAEKTKIVYSTHSPYMIDANCIDRHLIVEKKNDITIANKQDKNAQFSNNELLLRAIGTSIFEIIQEKNIIFEGWLDKELFQKYCDFHKKTSDFINIGIVYLGGISGVETLVQLLILANKKFIIVADSDKPSKDKRKEFEKNYKEFAPNWLSYADVVNNVSTMEDFVTSEHITNCVKDKAIDFIYNNSKNAIENIEAASKNNKELKQSIKNRVVENLTLKDIKPEYGTFIIRLKEKLDNMSN
ncbi:MAG: AAA family ATPase [Bacteroidales bacterium]|jgi:predicted ATP-dependent endonuclease of OLD family|nr:AAA family ATPase [Bacteroidales bacterium]